MIEYEIHQSKELADELAQIFNDFFELPADISGDVEKFISSLENGCTFVVEYPYVDKVFRDSFYTYFSSKLSNYPRNCIRVSVFAGDATLSDFRNHEKQQVLKEKYGGFFVVRPTYPNPIGRTILSKNVLANDDFLNCKTSYPITCAGVKYSLEGFPYSSQDRETISCAETTIWGIMEYFSNRYAKYSPALPSDIIEALQDRSYERQLPSSGLNVYDLSFALRQFDFEPHIYGREEFGEDMLMNLLSCYVESGIPVAVAVSNEDDFKHAMICCGREKMETSHFEGLNTIKGLTDFDDIRKQFVFMDDNLFPYQKAYLDEPVANYDASLDDTEIKHFVAPLYPKIYLEAFEAKSFCISLLASNGFKKDTFRILLTSSRSYKDEILKNTNLPDEYKERIMKLPMPKFIWVCEITDEEHLSKEKCYGTVILDATEPNINRYKPLIFMHIEDATLYKEKGSLSSDKLSNSLSQYDVYQNNLSGF